MIIVSTHIHTYAPIISVYSSDLPAAVCHLQILHNSLLSYDIFCIAVEFEYRKCFDHVAVTGSFRNLVKHLSYCAQFSHIPFKIFYVSFGMEEYILFHLIITENHNAMLICRSLVPKLQQVC